MRGNEVGRRVKHGERVVTVARRWGERGGNTHREVVGDEVRRGLGHLVAGQRLVARQAGVARHICVAREILVAGEV